MLLLSLRREWLLLLRHRKRSDLTLYTWEVAHGDRCGPFPALRGAHVDVSVHVAIPISAFTVRCYTASHRVESCPVLSRAWAQSFMTATALQCDNTSMLFGAVNPSHPHPRHRPIEKPAGQGSPRQQPPEHRHSHHHLCRKPSLPLVCPRPHGHNRRHPLRHPHNG